MRLRDCLQPRLLTSWGIITNLQLENFLENKVFPNIPKPIRLVNIAAGLSLIGYNMLQKNIVSEVVNTDISEISKQYHTFLASSLHPMKKKNYHFLYQRYIQIIIFTDVQCKCSYIDRCSFPYE